jgi:hypothetical protein
MPKTLERRDVAQFLPCVTTLATGYRYGIFSSPSVSLNNEAILEATVERDGCRQPEILTVRGLSSDDLGVKGIRTVGVRYIKPSPTFYVSVRNIFPS